MAYSDFTLDALQHRFGMTVEIKSGLFAPVPPVSVGAAFTEKRFLQREHQIAYVDLEEIYIAEADKIFGGFTLDGSRGIVFLL